MRKFLFGTCHAALLLAFLAALASANVFAKDQKADTAKAEKEKEARKVFERVPEDPNLPRVLLIGDSISIGYTLPVRRLLEGTANVQRAPENCGPTTRGIQQLDKWLNGEKWDVIHFNFGLHDVKHMKNGKNNLSGPQQVPDKEYKKNLEELVKRLEATGATLVWATTTPVPDRTDCRIKGEEKKANKTAIKIMKRRKIAVDDLYAHVLPKLADSQLPNNVHFTKEGYELLAEKVAAEIRTALEKHGKCAKKKR